MTIETRTMKGAFNLTTGTQEPDETYTTEDIGQAPRHIQAGPMPKVFWDCREWRAGFINVGHSGATVLNDVEGILIELGTGRVYKDSRFKGGQA